MLRHVAIGLWLAIAAFIIPTLIYQLVIKPRLHVSFFQTYATLPFIERWRARWRAFRTWLIGALGLIFGGSAEIISYLNIVPLPEWLAPYQGMLILILTIGGMLWSQAQRTTPEGVPYDQADFTNLPVDDPGTTQPGSA